MKNKNKKFEDSLNNDNTSETNENQKNSSNNQTSDKINEKNSKAENKCANLKNSNAKNKEQEYLQALQCTQAEFENYRKRVERDRENFAKFASENFVKKLLPSLDNFERCLANASEKNHNEFVEAIKMVHDQIWKELNNEGVKRIDAENTQFNPELHEPLLQEESDKPENTVLQVLEAGYTFNGKVLRHARVKLSKKKSE